MSSFTIPYQVSSRRPVGVLAAVLIASLGFSPLACSGGDGGGGGGPTTPSGQGPVSGAYAGNINWQTPGSPPEHCLARWLDDETNGTAHGFRVQVSLDQIGTALSGIFQGRDITTTCELEGTVAEDGTMRWNSTRCAQPCYHFAHPTLMCPALDICLVERTVVADFEAGRIVGTHRVVWNAVEAESGSPHGQVTFEGDLDIQR